MARLATVWPLDQFDTRIDGVPVLTLSGADVPDEHVDGVRELARMSGVQLLDVADPAAPKAAPAGFTETTTPDANATPEV